MPRPRKSPVKAAIAATPVVSTRPDSALAPDAVMARVRAVPPVQPAPPPKMVKRVFDLDGDIHIVVTAPAGAMVFEQNESMAYFATKGAVRSPSVPALTSFRETSAPAGPVAAPDGRIYTNNLGENENPAIGTMRDLPPGAPIPGMGGDDPFLQRIAGIAQGIIAQAEADVKREEDDPSGQERADV